MIAQVINGLRRQEKRTLTAANVPANLLATNYAPQSVTPTSALTIADAYACVRVLSESAAALPLIAYRRQRNGERERYYGPLADLLQRPAAATTQANLIGQMVAHLNLYGNTFVGKFRQSGDDRVDSLSLLHPESVKVELVNGVPVYTVITEEGREIKLSVDSVIHVRAMSTDGVYGLSPIKQARAALSLSGALTTHATQFFTHGARPSGVLKTPHSLSSDAQKRLRADWEAMHGGVDRAHRIAILEEELDFQAIGGPLDQLQFEQQRKLSTTEVARIFRVPPWMIGADTGGSLTYSNTENQMLAFVTHSLRPWLVLIEQALSADVDLCPPGVFCEFLVDALLRSDSQSRAEVYTRALDPVTGWMTREEVRRRENLDPADDHPPAAAPLPKQPAERSEMRQLSDALTKFAQQKNSPITVEAPPAPQVNVEIRGSKVRREVIRDGEGRITALDEQEVPDEGTGTKNDRCRC
jgi:HK97 family phage portal protein